MAGLLITNQNPRPGVKPDNLSAILVAGRAFAVAEKFKTISWGGQSAVIMVSFGRGWSLARGQMGNVG